MVLKTLKLSLVVLYCTAICSLFMPIYAQNKKISYGLPLLARSEYTALLMLMLVTTSNIRRDIPFKS